MNKKVESFRLSPELEKMIDEAVESGEYENKSQAIRALIRKGAKAECDKEAENIPAEKSGGCVT